MQQDKIKENKHISHKLTNELYDLYAPPVYGKVLSIVQKDPIAEKVFEKVFVSAYTNDKTFPLRSPLMSLIDLAHEKSHKTIKALNIFNACCSGTTVSITDKEIAS
jgi:DNA-directed RNA polymerase specialized sigma24 family protein